MKNKMAALVDVPRSVAPTTINPSTTSTHHTTNTNTTITTITNTTINPSTTSTHHTTNTNTTITTITTITTTTTTISPPTTTPRCTEVSRREQMQTFHSTLSNKKNIVARHHITATHGRAYAILVIITICCTNPQSIAGHDVRDERKTRSRRPHSRERTRIPREPRSVLHRLGR